MLRDSADDSTTDLSTERNRGQSLSEETRKHMVGIATEAFVNRNTQKQAVGHTRRVEYCAAVSVGRLYKCKPLLQACSTRSKKSNNCKHKVM